MAEKLTPMMQQYFEVEKKVFSGLFTVLFADVFSSEKQKHWFANDRQKTLILGVGGITKVV